MRHLKYALAATAIGAMLGLASQPSFAAPLNSAEMKAIPYQAEPLIQKVHGWHCRKRHGGTTATSIGIATAEPVMTMTIITTITATTHLIIIQTPSSVFISMTIIIATITGTRGNTTWDTEVTWQPGQAAHASGSQARRV